MKNWKIKRFCLFAGPEYETSLGLDGFVHSTNTLAQMQKWLIENVPTDSDNCFEWWQVDDLQTGETVLCNYYLSKDESYSNVNNDFVDNIEKIRFDYEKQKIKDSEKKEEERKKWEKNPKRLP